MKKIFAILICLLLFVSNVFAITAEDLEKYSVHIFSIGNEGIGSCTGTVLTNTPTKSTVLTCKHCIGMDNECNVDNKSVSSIFMIPGEDLAILTIDGFLPNKTPAKLANSKALSDDIVMYYGKPGFIFTHPREGTVITNSKEWGFAQLEIVGGCSGSGLFNEYEELVGVLWGGYTERGEDLLFSGPSLTSIALFEPLGDIERFLSSYNGE